MIVRRAAMALLTAAALAITGCSADPAMPGENGPGAGPSSSVGAVPASSPASAEAPSSTSGALPGLTVACTAVLNAQAAISAELGKALNGDSLTKDGVTATFDKVSPDLPDSLDGDVATLKSAMLKAVGQSADQVANIISGSAVSGALQKLTNYIQSCAPSTSG